LIDEKNKTTARPLPEESSDDEEFDSVTSDDDSQSIEDAFDRAEAHLEDRKEVDPQTRHEAPSQTKVKVPEISAYQ
jgi:hypothetical protein